MIFLKVFVASKLIKMNFLKFSKIDKIEKQVFNGFSHFSNFSLCRYNDLNPFCKNKRTVSRQFSSKVFEGTGKYFGSADLSNSGDFSADFDNIGEEEDNEHYEEHEEHRKLLKEQEAEMPIIDLFEEISDGDPNILKKLKILEFEIAVLKEGGNKIPEKICKENWLELLNLSSLSARKQYLSFICTNELVQHNHIVKGKLLLEQKMKKRIEAGFHYYGLNGHTMFFRIYPKTLSQLLSLRQMTATQRILFDCSYQAYMNQKNLKNCAKQIFLSLSLARTHQYPLRIELCNFDVNDYLGKSLPKYVLNAQHTFGADIYKESYLDKYPKEKLLYLTPHAPNELTEFRKDYIYIIGAFVDKGNGAKVSLAKAKENNIKMAKFPLDYYLSWKSGTKSLPLNIVTNILLDMYFYNNWFKALRHIPSRSLNDPRSKRKWNISCQHDPYLC